MDNNWQQQRWGDRSDIEDRHCCPWNSAIRRVSPRYFDCLVSDRFYRAIKVLIDQQNVSNGKCTRAHALNFFLSDLSRMYTFDTIFDAVNRDGTRNRRDRYTVAKVFPGLHFERFERKQEREAAFHPNNDNCKRGSNE